MSFSFSTDQTGDSKKNDDRRRRGGGNLRSSSNNNHRIARETDPLLLQGTSNNPHSGNFTEQQQQQQSNRGNTLRARRTSKSPIPRNMVMSPGEGNNSNEPSNQAYRTTNSNSPASLDAAAAATSSDERSLQQRPTHDGYESMEDAVTDTAAAAAAHSAGGGGGAVSLTRTSRGPQQSSPTMQQLPHETESDEQQPDEEAPTTQYASYGSNSGDDDNNNNNNLYQHGGSPTGLSSDQLPHKQQQQQQNSNSSRINQQPPPPRHHQQQQHQHLITSSGDSDQPPLLEIPEEIYAVRKAALQVLKPLTKTWVVISVGFALTVLFGMARWTRLLPAIPFWFILFPCWASHMGLLWLHVLSAKALSAFIADANDSRQRPDSRDHLNRTEYLPLLQRSLKFGLKTGLLSFCMFLFEILIYVRLAHTNNGKHYNSAPISLCGALFPIWLLVTGGILDGFVCKTQHFLRVLCWLLAFCAMILLVLKVDYGMDNIRWRMVFSPVICVLAIASASLVYIVYGHQIGYYRLTESQLTAGNLYSLAALICIVLFVMIGEVIPLTRPVEIETRLFVVILAPLAVCLVGMGAWVVSRDEFGRLLLYGGQSAVHPMKLRWQSRAGWTSVQGKGVTVIPMFGEVSFQPLERKATDNNKVMELGSCLNAGGGCYPYEEDLDEETALIDSGAGEYDHPYLDASHSFSRKGPFARTS